MDSSHCFRRWFSGVLPDFHHRHFTGSLVLLAAWALVVGGVCGPLRAGADDSRLVDVAVRSVVGGPSPLIAGFTIGPGAAQTVLIRAVGPALAGFGVTGTAPDPKLQLFTAAGLKIAENDNFNTADAATFAAVGAFALPAGSRDAALVATLPAGGYTAQATDVTGSSGVALVEVYEVSHGGARLINLSSRGFVGAGDDLLVPGIVIAPGTGTRRLLLRAVGPGLAPFGVTGLLADPKLELFSSGRKLLENDNWSAVVAPAAGGAAELAAAFAASGAFPLPVGSRDAALLVDLGPGNYSLHVSGVGATTGTALAEVYDLTPATTPPPGTVKPSASLYLAQLRPDAAAPGSTASGYATLTVNTDGTASVSVTFSNLAAEETGAHLQLGASRDFVLSLPSGQVAGLTWNFAPTGRFTTDDLIAALNSGNLFVSLDSTRFPAGELRGNFIAATGSAAFTAPGAPPALPAGLLASPAPTEAARFLMQATYGPTEATIAALRTRGIPGWIDDQLALPATSALAALRADLTAFPNPVDPATRDAQTFAERENWNAAWWKIAATAPDQLRQRVAFALSEIFVVGHTDALSPNLEASAAYYDLLVQGAFGNYRALLEAVTLSPAMGVWLNHQGNRAADPVRGTAPDENYAREVQQLFSLGLVQLQPDGTLRLDASGQPIPTYSPAMIADTARVFTGWSFAHAPAETTDAAVFSFATPPSSARGRPLADDSGWLRPMRYFDAFHDHGAKQLVSLQQVAPAAATPTVLAAGSTGPQDLADALDTFFRHPNTGPFFCRQLIQRLVTSNPSPAYVYRVAQVFADDGTGARGNLGAVVRAILSDYEARSPDVTSHPGYGKIKEPLIRLAAFFRALRVTAPNGRYLDSWFGDPRNGGRYSPQSAIGLPLVPLGEEPMQAPTVFNFFSPDYSPPGPMAAAGLVAPELQITDAIYAITVPNVLTQLLYRDVAALPAPPAGPSPFLVPDYSALLPLARDPAALVAALDLLFCAGQMSDATRAQIIVTLSALPPFISDALRVKAAVQFTLISPDGALQK